MSLGSVPANEKTVAEMMREYDHTVTTDINSFTFQKPLNVIYVFSSIPLYVSLGKDYISLHTGGSDQELDGLRLNHPGGNIIKPFFQESEFKDVYFQSRTLGGVITITPGRFVGD